MKIGIAIAISILAIGLMLCRKYKVESLLYFFLYVELAYEFFGFYHNGSIYYLSNNPESLVFRQVLGYDNIQVRTIPNSKIPNFHQDERGIIGILTNRFFWVLGGHIADKHEFGKCSLS